MKRIKWFTIIALLAGICLRGSAADEEGIAIGIVYDTSGSMKDSVRAGNGQMTPKFVIANRAIEAIVQRIQTFATNTPGGMPRKIHAGLFIFDGNSARAAVPFGPFEAGAIRTFVRKFNSPTSGTPLGNAVEFASRPVLASPLSSKHLLVVTDGMNTVGPPPDATIPKIQKNAVSKNTTVFTHFVAFDVNANIFASLKKLGVTVVGAADEKQLNSQLEFILEEKILLEKEPVPKKK